MANSLHTIKRFPSKDDILNEHIVDTYFHQKKKEPVEEKPAKKIGFFEKNRKIIVACLVTALACVLIFIISLFFHRITEHLNRLTQQRLAASKLFVLSRGGAVNKSIVRKADFLGYAKGKGFISREHIVLKNLGKYEWADLVFDFKFPVDFSSRYLVITLKSQIGGEKLNIVLRDTNNRSVRLRDVYLTSNWRYETIPLASVQNEIDLAKITHMRFECDYVGMPSRGVGLPIDVLIYMKDIKLAKEEAL